MTLLSRSWRRQRLIAAEGPVLIAIMMTTLSWSLGQPWGLAFALFAAVWAVVAALPARAGVYATDDQLQWISQTREVLRTVLRAELSSLCVTENRGVVFFSVRDRAGMLHWVESVRGRKKASARLGALTDALGLSVEITSYEEATQTLHPDSIFDSQPRTRAGTTSARVEEVEALSLEAEVVDPVLNATPDVTEEEEVNHPEFSGGSKP